MYWQCANPTTAASPVASVETGAAGHLASIDVEEVVGQERGTSLGARRGQLDIRNGGLCARRNWLQRLEDDARAAEGLHRVWSAAVVQHRSLRINAHPCGSQQVIEINRIYNQLISHLRLTAYLMPACCSSGAIDNDSRCMR